MKLNLVNRTRNTTIFLGLLLALITFAGAITTKYGKENCDGADMCFAASESAFDEGAGFADVFKVDIFGTFSNSDNSKMAHNAACCYSESDTVNKLGHSTSVEEVE